MASALTRWGSPPRATTFAAATSVKALGRGLVPGAGRLELEVVFDVGDLRDVVTGNCDVVLTCDDSLRHLLSDMKVSALPHPPRT